MFNRHYVFTKFVFVFTFWGNKVMAVIAHNRPLNDSPSILNVAVSHFFERNEWVSQFFWYSFLFFLGEEVINMM